jgi:zinc transport system ATP-binding protein
VHFAYDEAEVISGAGFEVESGDAVCIVGPNGGGKTTLLRLILGLLKPDSGSIRVFGRAPEAARRRVGYVPQYVDLDLLFPITAIEVVLMGRLGRRLGGSYSRADREAAAAALDELGMADLADRSFAGLSVGQRQRVFIARALCSEPDLLLLDEPTANVDAFVEERLYGTLARLRERMTIMMISHDLAFVSSIFEKVICVHRTVAVHPTSDITDATLRELYGEEFRLVRHDHGELRAMARTQREGESD